MLMVVALTRWEEAELPWTPSDEDDEELEDEVGTLNQSTITHNSNKGVDEMRHIDVVC